MHAMQSRHDFDTALVEDIVLGCVSPVGDQGAVIPKTAALAAALGAPVHDLGRFNQTLEDMLALLHR